MPELLCSNVARPKCFICRSRITSSMRMRRATPKLWGSPTLRDALAVSLQEKKPMPCRSLSRTYGTVSVDEQKDMSGLEFVQGLVNGKLPLNTIAQILGYDVTEAENGRVF